MFDLEGINYLEFWLLCASAKRHSQGENSGTKYHMNLSIPARGEEGRKNMIWKKKLIARKVGRRAGGKGERAGCIGRMFN